MFNSLDCTGEQVSLPKGHLLYVFLQAFLSRILFIAKVILKMGTC